MASWTSAPPAVAAQRGIVHRASTLELFDLGRTAVGPNLQPFAEHVWSVCWDRGAAGPRASRTIPFPSLHLTVEDGSPGEVRHGHRMPATLLHGVVTRCFEIGLRGSGWVVGVKFRPGGWSAWSGRDAAGVTDQVVPAAPLLTGLDVLGGVVLAAPGMDERRAAMVAVMERWAPEPNDDYLRLRALIERMRDDGELVRVEQLPELVGWSSRTLQRQFRRMVGVSAKWVLARFRLQEAAVMLEREPELNLAELSVRLGWHDQAHFTNDFRRVLGTTPGRYAAEARKDSQSEEHR